MEATAHGHDAPEPRGDAAAHPSQALFREEQKRTQPRWWAFVATVAAGLSLIVAIALTWQPDTLATSVPPWLAWAVFILLALMWVFMMWFAFTAKFETVVHPDRLELNYTPLPSNSHHVDTADIVAVKRITFSTGLRPEERTSAWMPWGRTYKIDTDLEGVEVRLKNSEVLHIGTRRPEALEAALRKATGV